MICLSLWNTKCLKNNIFQQVYFKQLQIQITNTNCMFSVWKYTRFKDRYFLKYFKYLANKFGKGLTHLASYLKQCPEKNILYYFSEKLSKEC